MIYLRHIFLFMLLVAPLFSGDPTLPPAEDGKPVYQKTGRPWPLRRYRRVGWPCEEIDFEQQNRIWMSKRGRMLLFICGIAAVLGVVVSVYSQNQFVDNIGNFVAFGGAALAGFGMFLMKISEWWKWLGYAALILVAIGITVWYRKRRPGKNGENLPSESAGREQCESDC